ncbi:hypothetical protein EHS39_25320 [Ensifer sp. MPMI2T]|nr:hypothetical protein EHS39_25320 [Ensifer sp. MPMI2T]
MGRNSARRQTHYLESKLVRRDGRNLVQVLVPQAALGDDLEEVFKAPCESGRQVSACQATAQ